MITSRILIKSALLADYFKYIFPPDPEDGLCRISTTHPTGSLIIALAEPAPFAFNPEGEHVLGIAIPYSRNASSAIEGRWVFFTKSSMSRINLALQAEFDIEFAGYYRRGEQLGIRKMDIIEAFILSRNLAAESYDSLHKRVYRKELKSLKEIRRKLLRKAYYINESIDYTGLKSNETSGD